MKMKKTIKRHSKVLNVPSVSCLAWRTTKRSIGLAFVEFILSGN